MPKFTPHKNVIKGSEHMVRSTEVVAESKSSLFRGYSNFWSEYDFYFIE